TPNATSPCARCASRPPPPHRRVRHKPRRTPRPTLNAASDTARPAAAFSKPDPPPAAPPTLARPPRPSRRRFAPQAGGRYLAPFPAAPPPGGTVGMLLTIETT